MKYSLALLTLLVITGCSAKKPVKTMNLDHMKHVEFRNVHNGQCVVAQILLDSKTGNYIVVCKVEK